MYSVPIYCERVASNSNKTVYVAKLAVHTTVKILHLVDKMLAEQVCNKLLTSCSKVFSFVKL